MEPQSGHRRTRLNHKKSRTGCERCKVRKVKCDEAKPACASCKRHGEPCNYNIFTVPVTFGKTSVLQMSATIHIDGAPESQGSDQPESSSTTGHSDGDECGIPEDKSERLIQLELLHNYYGPICKPFVVRQSPEVEATWQTEVPKIAFKHDNLLYAMFTISATCILRSHPMDLDLQTRRNRYLALALQEQRKAIDDCSKSNVDAISFAALLIQMNSFAMLHEHINPDADDGYAAVVAWLNTGNGAGQIFGMVAMAAEQNPASKFKVILNAPPAYSCDTSYHFRFEIPTQSQHLLEGSLARDERLSSDTRQIYEKTLRYLGTINNSNVERKPSFFAARQIQGFSMLIPKKFTCFVQQRRPLALAVLAHFFALVAQVEDPPWWVGDAPYKAIHAISYALHVGRKEVLKEMEWPCEIASQLELIRKAEQNL